MSRAVSDDFPVPATSRCGQPRLNCGQGKCRIRLSRRPFGDAPIEVAMTFKTGRPTAVRVLAIVLASAFSTLSWAQEKSNALAVAVEESPSAFTLKNGIVTARVSKRSGDLTSLAIQGHGDADRQVGARRRLLVARYDRRERDDHARHHRSAVPTAASAARCPSKGFPAASRWATAPAPPRAATFPPTSRFATASGRGDSGVYTYCTFEHLPELSGGLDDRGPLLRQAGRHVRLDDARRETQQALSRRPARRRQVHLHRGPVRAPRLRLVEHHARTSASGSSTRPSST